MLDLADEAILEVERLVPGLALLIAPFIDQPDGDARVEIRQRAEAVLRALKAERDVGEDRVVRTGFILSLIVFANYC